MAGIGRLKNKISPDKEEKEKKPTPLEKKTTPVTPPLEKEENKKVEKDQGAVLTSPNEILPSRWNQPKEPVPPASLSARDQLYQKITARSEEEKNEQRQFISRIMGKKVEKEKDSSTPEENVILQPVPQGPSRAEKIFVRLLIVLLVASLGFLVYLVVRGYLI